MLFNFEQMALLYKLEVMEEDNPFSDKDKKVLLGIMEDIEKLTFTRNPIKIAQSIIKYKKLETDFLNKFEQYGGNCPRLQDKIVRFNGAMLGLKVGAKKK